MNEKNANDDNYFALKHLYANKINKKDNINIHKIRKENA